VKQIWKDLEYVVLKVETISLTEVLNLLDASKDGDAVIVKIDCKKPIRSDFFLDTRCTFVSPAAISGFVRARWQ
jgi:hypothetical protein